jgi:hypothetical protein
MGRIREVHSKLKKAKGRVARTVRPGFWRKVMFALHPKSYSDLSSVRVKRGFGYLLSLLLASFIIMSIISLPRIAVLPEAISSEISRFDSINLSIDIETSAPVRIPEKDPQIVIDTENPGAKMGNEKILIAGDYIYYRPYASAKGYNLSEFNDLKEKKDDASRFLTFIFIVLIPTILLASYIMFLVKYIVSIAVMAALIFVMIRVAKRDIGIFRAWNTALYASTPMVLLEVVMIPFNSKYLVPVFQAMGMNFYLIPLLAYIALVGFSLYFVLGGKKGKKGKESPKDGEQEWRF